MAHKVEASVREGVSLPALHKAIARGAIVVHQSLPDDTRLAVSANRLARWTPNPVRQRARRKTAMPVS